MNSETTPSDNSTTSSSADLAILVVDDVFAARRIMSRFLEKLGFTNIAQAETGSSALAVLAGGNIQLVICDLHLTDMTGIELFRAMQKDAESSNTPFMIVTSDGDRQEFEEARQVGIANYLLKPFDQAALKAKIKETLEMSKAV
ncbi:response regulator [Oligoflexia bacterium]|nr:response regulator [Oligoflexia bacterium]